MDIGFKFCFVFLTREFTRPKFISTYLVLVNYNLQAVTRGYGPKSSGFSFNFQNPSRIIVAYGTFLSGSPTTCAKYQVDPQLRFGVVEISIKVFRTLKNRDFFNSKNLEAPLARIEPWTPEQKTVIMLTVYSCVMQKYLDLPRSYILDTDWSMLDVKTCFGGAAQVKLVDYCVAMVTGCLGDVQFYLEGSLHSYRYVKMLHIKHKIRTLMIILYQ